MVWNLFPFKVILVLGKARSCRARNLGCRGAESPGWSDVSSKNCARGVMHELVRSCDEAATHSCGLLNHPKCFCGGMFKLNAKFGADQLLYSLSLIECDGHTAHTLTQWCLPLPLTSTVKPSLVTHSHSSPLSLAAGLQWCHVNCYVNNGWTFSGQTLYAVNKIYF